MIVTRLFLLSELSFVPSKMTLALLRVKKIESKIIDELNMKGRMEIKRLTFRSDITANDAMVIPMANEPAFPTKILPRTLKKAKMSQKNRGPTIRMWDG